MATRYDKSSDIPGTLSSGYEGEATRDMSLPPCGIEDVDRAFYDLFNEKLPLFYKKSKESGEQTRIPVIFASGERFALVSKKEPFRDRNGALILPIVSITRSGVEQESTRAGGVSDRFNEMVIKKRISPEDPLYQNLVNSKNFYNSEFASAGKGSTESYDESTGRILEARLGQNVYEIFVIPMPKYFTLKYEVTIWCQYTQQANDVITAILGAYVQPGGRTIRIDTKKGYWFVAYFEPTVGQENNVSDFSDSERIIKVTLTAEVPGYLILPEFPGSSNAVRSFVSAPSISFTSTSEEEILVNAQNIPSGKVDSYILGDIETEDVPVIGDAIGVSPISVAETKAGSRRDGVRTATPWPDEERNGIIGKTSRVKGRTRTVTVDVDPRTGRRGRFTLRVTDANPSKGEEVLTIDVLENIRRG